MLIRSREYNYLRIPPISDVVDGDRGDVFTKILAIPLGRRCVHHLIRSPRIRSWLITQPKESRTRLLGLAVKALEKKVLSPEEDRTAIPPSFD